jgi:hypothetical protein
MHLFPTESNWIPGQRRIPSNVFNDLRGPKQLILASGNRFRMLSQQGKQRLFDNTARAMGDADEKGGFTIVQRPDPEYGASAPICPRNC